MTTPLKPCQFCGGEWTVLKFTCSHYATYQPKCRGCPAMIDAEYATEEEAIAAANRRHGEQAVAEECARIAESAMDGIVGHEIGAKIRARFGGGA